MHGLVGGYNGPGVKTVVPPSGQLKVSMRLVPNQNPKKIYAHLKAFLKKLNPDIRLECDGQLEPFRGVTGGPYADALRNAVQKGFGKTPSFIREGGSIGAVKLMERAWNVPILFMGLSLPEHGYHAPNEYFDWGQASGGIRAFVPLFCCFVALHQVMDEGSGTKAVLNMSRNYFLRTRMRKGVPSKSNACLSWFSKKRR